MAFSDKCFNFAAFVGTVLGNTQLYGCNSSSQYDAKTMHNSFTGFVWEVQAGYQLDIRKAVQASGCVNASAHSNILGLCYWYPVYFALSGTCLNNGATCSNS